ncbi:MAG: hypothetical protein KJ048_19335 [Dehalococcoidia bacterium]|nr:hypothetical protein [Dehalococcoidia bacterium]
MPRRPNRFAHERFTGVKLFINAVVVFSFFGGWALFNATNDLGHDSAGPIDTAPTILPGTPTAAPSPPATPAPGTPQATATAEPPRTPTPTPTQRKTRAS